MDGFIAQVLKGLGGSPHVLWGSFKPNGSSDPDSDDNTGPPGLKAFTTTYAATGVYTVTLPAGMSLPANATIVAFEQVDQLSSYFDVMTVGDYAATTRSFVLQAHRAGTGREVAAATGTRIHFVILFNNSTGY